MLLSELGFCSLLSYPPRGSGSQADRARTLRTALKRDSIVGQPPRPFSERIARHLASHAVDLGLATEFGGDVCLVPVPRSRLIRSGDLWVPQLLARALTAAGLAAECLPLLQRVTPLAKAATSVAADRPLPADHLASLAVDAQLLPARRILLVDDLITRGATLLGAASRLAEVYPSTPIAAFAAMRSISQPEAFRDVIEPVRGTITLRPRGDTLRRP